MVSISTGGQSTRHPTQPQFYLLNTYTTVWWQIFHHLFITRKMAAKSRISCPRRVGTQVIPFLARYLNRNESSVACSFIGLTSLRLGRGLHLALCSDYELCPLDVSRGVGLHIRGAKKQRTETKPAEVSTNSYCAISVTHNCVQKLLENTPATKSDEVKWPIRVLRSDVHLNSEIM